MKYEQDEVVLKIERIGHDSLIWIFWITHKKVGNPDVVAYAIEFEREGRSYYRLLWNGNLRKKLPPKIINEITKRCDPPNESYAEYICYPVVQFYSNFTEKKVNLNEWFKITLECNPTTGYIWTVDYDNDYLGLGSMTFNPMKPIRMGSGGVTEFDFIPIKVGETILKFLYVRPLDNTPIRREIYRVIII
jgi:predicted secreted protein